MIYVPTTKVYHSWPKFFYFIILKKLRIIIEHKVEHKLFLDCTKTSNRTDIGSRTSFNFAYLTVYLFTTEDVELILINYGAWSINLSFKTQVKVWYILFSFRINNLQEVKPSPSQKG